MIMNYYDNPIGSRFADGSPANQPPSYSQSQIPQLQHHAPPSSYPSRQPYPSNQPYPNDQSYPSNQPYPNDQSYPSNQAYPNDRSYLSNVPRRNSQNLESHSINPATPNYSSSQPPAYQSTTDNYQSYQVATRPLSTSASRESFQREPSAPHSDAQKYYNATGGTLRDRDRTSTINRGTPPHREASPQGEPYRYNTGASSPRHRYRSPEDYHYDYRGGFRPPTDVDTGSRDGYTTDGSGSGYRDGSVRGFENFRYPTERESLLLGKGKNPKYANSNGTTYSRESGEKQPFLGSVEPVRLTPSWEQRDVSKEELNFRNVKTFENFELDVEAPRDKFALVFLTLLLHGVGTLMPWNMFITAKNYFVTYKLGTATVDASEYTTNFLPYLGYASQVPNVLFNWLNVFFQMGGDLTTRIVGSILIEVLIFIVTVVLAMVDSSSWPGIFFWVTMTSVIILNVANGIYQNTIYGLAARLPFKYTGAVVLGSNISGTFTAVINIMAIAMAPNQRTSAIYYFITALFVLLACFDTYFALPLNRFFRYHEAINERNLKQAAITAGKSGQSQGCCANCKTSLPKVWHVFKKAFPQLFNVFMVFFVTLSVFPAVLADTCRTEENFFIPSKYFQAVTCFLTFNLFAMLGNMIPGLFMWPGPKFLCIPVLLRILFIPAFVLCHYYPYDVDRVMPVLIDSDYAYWALAILMGLTSGYYSSLAMMYCPRTVEPEHAPIAGMMGAASLITGIFAGINFQVVCSYAVTHISFDMPGYESTFRNCTDRMSFS